MVFANLFIHVFKFINDLWASDICPNITWVYYLLQIVHTYGITGLQQIHTNTKEYTNKNTNCCYLHPSKLLIERKYTQTRLWIMFFLYVTELLVKPVSLRLPLRTAVKRNCGRRRALSGTKFDELFFLNGRLKEMYSLNITNIYRGVTRMHNTMEEHVCW